MPTIIDLGRNAKSKYPQYKDLSDEEVGRRIKAKYPNAYGDYEDVTAKEPEKKRGFWGNVGQGIVGFGKGVANTVDSAATLGQKALSNTVGKILPGDKPEVASLPKNITTPTNAAQKIGFGAEQLGEFFIPGGAAMKVGKAAQTALGTSKLAKAARVGVTALTEAGISGGQTALQGGSRADVRNAAITGGVFATGSQGINKILKELPENAWRNILKRTSSQVAKNPDLAAEAAATGLVGTQKGILAKAQRNIQTLELSLDDLLKTRTGIIDGEKVATYLDALKKTYRQVPGESYAVNIIGTLQQEMRDKGMLTLNDANKLKRSIYDLVQKSYGKGTLEIPAKIEGQKLLAAGIKQELEKAVPEVKQLNQQQAVYIQIKKAIERQMAQGEGRGIAGVRLGGYDLLGGGLGTIAGIASGQPLLGAGFVGGKKIIESPLTQSITAKVANYFDNLSPTKKALFYNALKGVSVSGAKTSSSEDY